VLGSGDALTQAMSGGSEKRDANNSRERHSEFQNGNHHTSCFEYFRALYEVRGKLTPCLYVHFCIVFMNGHGNGSWLYMSPARRSLPPSCFWGDNLKPGAYNCC